MSRKAKVTVVGPMRLLLEIHSILNTGGPFNSQEISDRLLLREIDFTVEMLHTVLNSDAAAYFLIRRLNDTNSFEVVPQKMYQVGVASKHQMNYPKGPMPWPKGPQVAIIHVDRTPQVEVITPATKERKIVKAARKEEILTFCRLKGRLPSQTEPLEKSMYHFINNNKNDADFVAKLSGYKGKVGRLVGRPSKYNDDELGMQLADSGGGGSF